MPFRQACSAATGGAAAVRSGDARGSRRDHTILHELGWHEGVRDRPLRGQGSKMPALDSPLLRFVQLTQALAPPQSFPRDLPVTVAAIGDFVIATVPAEMTTAMGSRLRAALGRDHTGAAIVGLANEYVGYATTPEEYAMQDYMGASTIWGPHEGTYLLCEILGLHAELAVSEPPQVEAGRRRYEVGPAPLEPFGPRFLGEGHERPDAELEKLLRTSGASPTRALPMFAWEEPAPASGSELDAATQRRVVIEERIGGRWQPRRSLGRIDDDRGSYLLNILWKPEVASEGTPRRGWSSIWIAPLVADITGDTSIAGELRFRVDHAGGAVCSAPFRWPSAAVDNWMEEAACQ
ncbi:MAG TPA: neutral/alkaline non-lysosomal ceramidase N-terminal domain-containing protein [Candidatus Binatia bacterium]|nr:neutral/alkaline non-lysosomal ceramidase N-terminal domain-containing protein [Candidatus Binatia bacterium]